jgi:hypothetical protein
MYLDITIPETAKKGGCPEDHLGIKNWIKKIPVD